jgi:hypothetical protein
VKGKNLNSTTTVFSGITGSSWNCVPLSIRELYLDCKINELGIGEGQMMRTTVRRKAKDLETAMGARKNEPSEEAPVHKKASRKESA